MENISILNAIILGIVEGLTEFLPVSSTGHLLLAGHFFDIVNKNGVFEVVIQLGAILAIVVLFFGKLWNAVITLPSSKESQHFALSVLSAFIPAAVIGFLAHDFIKEVLFASPKLIAIVLILGGFVIIIVERFYKPEKIKYKDSDAIPLKTSLGIGLFQCVAMIPGVSRSGATIIGAMLLGVNRKAAAEFSFFLSIPTMIGAASYDLYKNIGVLNSEDLISIGVGFIAAFISALLVVKWFIGFISKSGLVPFAWYRIIAGSVVLLALYLM
ncbi:MAG: undecaprenyl-diphosphate phosphatase [Alphaproteobacteria bacterium]|nr:undecaprenyl-diphosphate phosphatase [Alphaproteobacteria bacterium]MCL2505876.1 undecaprenyl-diphosphate phosphatase [Alphaproteobacteria bacterium]